MKLRNIHNNQPTAYDIDKIAEELNIICTLNTIEIVKQGSEVEDEYDIEAED